MGERLSPSIIDDLRTCTKCPNLGARHCRAIGNKNARFMLITEYPWEEAEVASCIIASGPLGDWYTYLCDQSTFPRDMWYFTSLVKCAPKDGNGKRPRAPEDEEIVECVNTWLLDEIRLVNPSIVVVVGGLTWGAVVKPGEDKPPYYPGNYVDWDGRFWVACYDPRFFAQACDISGFVHVGDVVSNLAANDKRGTT